jgi:hypothetical protein
MKYLLLCEVNVEFSIASHIHMVECETVNLFQFYPLSTSFHYVVVLTYLGATITKKRRERVKERAMQKHRDNQTW